MTKRTQYNIITEKLSEAYDTITRYGFCRRAYNRLDDCLFMARGMTDIPKNRALRAHIITARDACAKGLGIHV